VDNLFLKICPDMVVSKSSTAIIGYRGRDGINLRVNIPGEHKILALQKINERGAEFSLNYIYLQCTQIES
jgi:hypothetical protein